MHVTMPGRQAWVMLLTIARLGLAVGLCAAVILGQSPYITLVWLTAIVVSDIGDGVIARRIAADNTRRRIADAVVDRLSIHGAMIALALAVPGAVWLILAVFIRDVVLIAFNLWVLIHKRAIVTVSKVHKAGTLLYAVLYGVALFPVSSWSWLAAAAISAIVWFLLFDYLRAGWLIPAQPKGGPIVRYRTHGLAALRGKVPSSGISSA